MLVKRYFSCFQIYVYTGIVKFITQSKHGQEMIIITVLALLVAGFFMLKHYQSQLFTPGQNACMADCSSVQGNFRRYIHNILSVDQCICERRGIVSNIWN